MNKIIQWFCKKIKLNNKKNNPTILPHIHSTDNTKIGLCFYREKDSFVIKYNILQIKSIDGQLKCIAKGSNLNDLFPQYQFDFLKTDIIVISFKDINKCRLLYSHKQNDKTIITTETDKLEIPWGVFSLKLSYDYLQLIEQQKFYEDQLKYIVDKLNSKIH